MAYVVPVHKKDPPIISNFRPVSVTSVVCRTMERMVRDALIGHLESAKLLPKNQFGFRARHSVTDALLGCMDDWTAALQARHYVDCAYIDFSNAFDKLCHKRLLRKLYEFGIESYLLQWVQQFLTNLYTADLLRALEGTCTVVAYADDVKFYKTYSSPAETDRLQDALDITEEWSVENCLPLNAKKCTVLYLGN
ncbi:RNA-directed DNA polymerase from mobile element jockey-like protein, partial [Aphelenchoides avenae]